MFAVVLVLIITFLLVVTAELLWRVKKYHSELTRKFVHITVGSFAAFWPWFLTWRQIEALSLLFLLVVLASKSLSLFGSIHLIGRKTFGEVIFAISIGLTALITHNKYVFMAAIMHMSLADGLAAVVGNKWGKKYHYTILGQYKTLLGSITFWTCSLIILTVYYVATGLDPVPMIIWLPFATTLFENIGIRGTDNLLVPLIVALALR